MAEVDIIAHLDAVESRIRGDIAEVRKDVKENAIQTAGHEERLAAAERQVKWIWGSAGSSFLTMVGVFTKHLLGAGHGR